MSRKKKNLARDSVILMPLLFYSVVIIFPFLIVIITSLTPVSELNASMRFIWKPENPSLEAFDTVLLNDIYAKMLYGSGMSSIIRGFLNTLWQVIPSGLGGLFISGLSGYAFAKLRFRGKDALFACTFAAMVIPGIVLQMPRYLWFSTLGWTNTPLPMIIPDLFGSVGTMFFLRQYYASIPDDMIAAGRIDGLGNYGIFHKIIIPLSKPAFLTQALLMFVAGYNNYNDPLLYLSNYPELAPLQLALSLIQGGYVSPAIRCASAIVGMAPLLIIYAFAHKYFTQDMVAGGVKA